MYGHVQIKTIALNCKDRKLTVDAKPCFRYPTPNIHDIKIHQGCLIKDVCSRPSMKVYLNILKQLKPKVKQLLGL